MLNLELKVQYQQVGGVLVLASDVVYIRMEEMNVKSGAHQETTWFRRTKRRPWHDRWLVLIVWSAKTLHLPLPCLLSVRFGMCNNKWWSIKCTEDVRSMVQYHMVSTSYGHTQYTFTFYSVLENTWCKCKLFRLAVAEDSLVADRKICNWFIVQSRSSRGISRRITFIPHGLWQLPYLMKNICRVHDWQLKVSLSLSLLPKCWLNRLNCW